MTIIPIYLDYAPDYLRSEDGRRTLLLTPVGPRLLIEELRERVAGLTEAQPNVLLLDVDESGARPEYGVGVKVIRRLNDVTRNAEPSDWLLLVDSRYSSIDPAEYAALGENLKTTGEARYLAAMDNSRRGMREFVQFDEEKRVQRVERLYDGVTWQRTRAVIAALVPVSAARESVGGTDITQLRRDLVSRGVVSRDRSARGVVYGLEHETGMLHLFEEQVRRAAASGERLNGFVRHAPGVWAAENCRIHPTARLYGPVILHDGACVEEDATLIGPVLVGAKGRVEAGSVLAECLVMPGAKISAGAAVRFRVFNDRADDRESSSADDEEALSAFASEHAYAATSALAESGRTRQGGAFTAFKRAIDVIISLVALIALSPVMLLTAAAVKLTSRGPVFFCHEREGLNGAHFQCRKYRTMSADAHQRQRELYDANAVDGPQFKMARDPRITSIGRLLRKTNLDELPQLFNVLRGQMSLIGPRPSPFRENQICVPWRETRLAVRPGITGLWQICRHERDAGDFHQWIEYDMLYVRHMSLGLDLKILAATLLTLGGRWSVPVNWIVPASQQAVRHKAKRSVHKKKPALESAPAK